jgi:hypothetical protein
MSKATKPQKSALPLRSDEKHVAPAVKAWLDNVIVPALVEQWLAARPEGHGVNSSGESHNAESETARSETQ